MLHVAMMLACALSPASAAEIEGESGFRSLFDGQSLNGWDGDSQFWRVENGTIVGETTAEKQPADKKNTFLIYRGGEFSDFELRFEYKVQGYNAGVQYRSVDLGNFHVKGLQADFEAPWHEDKPTSKTFDRFSGMFFEEGGRGFLGRRGDAVVVRTNPKNSNKPLIEKVGSVGDPAELAKAIQPGDWNDYTVIANGRSFMHIINGRVMSVGLDLDEKNFRESGILAFQLHSGKPMKIEVKNIRIREIK